MISIVLCTYNRAHTLRESIDSILAQTWQDFELIIVDDGSTDSTQELLREYQDDRIRVYAQQENQFYCIAVNIGISKMRGDYLAFATSDDLWEPDKLELQMRVMESRPECAACFSFSDVIDEKGRPASGKFEMLSGLLVKNYQTQREWVRHFIFDGNCLSHPSALVRRSVIDEVGGFNLMYCQSGDMDLWLRIVRKYPIHVIEKDLVHYRCYEDPQEQISGVDELKSARFFNEHMLIRKKFIEDLSAEELRQFFGDCMRKPDARTPLEIEIEKAFLLMDCTHHLPGLRVLGIEKLERLLRDPAALEVLKSEYGIRIHDIYQWNLEHFYMDFGIHVRLADRDRRVRELEEEGAAREAALAGQAAAAGELRQELSRTEEARAEAERELERLRFREEELAAAYEKQSSVLEERIQELTETERRRAAGEEKLRELSRQREELEETCEEQRLSLTVAQKDGKKKDARIQELELLLDQLSLDRLRVKEESLGKRRGKRR